MPRFDLGTKAFSTRYLDFGNTKHETMIIETKLGSGIKVTTIKKTRKIKVRKFYIC